MNSVGYRFSVVIPTYSRPESLRACLESMAEQSYPKRQFEVVVVDDGSPNSVEPIISPFRERLNLTLARQENGGPSSARNVGASLARGQFLAFTDDDCMPARNWLHEFESHFNCQSDCMLGGRTVNRLVDDVYAVSSQILVDMLYEFYNAAAESGVARFFTANNLAVPADDFARLGGFNDTFRWAAAEDRELCDRWVHSGRRMIFASEAVVQHAHHLSLPGFCRQHFSYGRGVVAYQRMRAQLGLGSLIGPRGFHAQFLKLCWPLLKQLPPGRSSAVACLLLLSQLSTAAGFACESCAWRRFRKESAAHGRSCDSNPARESVLP